MWGDLQAINPRIFPAGWKVFTGTVSSLGIVPSYEQVKEVDACGTWSAVTGFVYTTIPGMAMMARQTAAPHCKNTSVVLTLLRTAT